LFPITSETYGTGSLAETGFSILNAIKLENRRDFVIMIEQQFNFELLNNNPLAAKESLRARALVVQHLKKLNFSNVYLVDNLEQMLEVSIVLWKSCSIKNEIKNFSITSK